MFIDELLLELPQEHMEPTPLSYQVDMRMMWTKEILCECPSYSSILVMFSYFLHLASTLEQVLAFALTVEPAI